MEVTLQITVESKVEVGAPILVMKDLTDIWTGQKISEQRRMEKRLDIWHVMRNMLREQQDVVVVMAVINECKEFIVRLMKLMHGNDLLLMVQRNWDLESQLVSIFGDLLLAVRVSVFVLRNVLKAACFRDGSVWIHAAWAERAVLSQREVRLRFGRGCHFGSLRVRAVAFDSGDQALGRATDRFERVFELCAIHVVGSEVIRSDVLDPEVAHDNVSSGFSF